MGKWGMGMEMYANYRWAGGRLGGLRGLAAISNLILSLPSRNMGH